MKPAASLSLCLVGLVVCLAGCRHAPGVTSFKFVDADHPKPPADARTLKLQTATTVFVDAKPIEPLAIPLFPKAALAAHLGAVTITVRISIGTDGRVMAVMPSMADVSIPTHFDREFHEAIESALAQWRFEPAKLAQLLPVKDRPPAVLDVNETETSFDVAFTFSPSGTVSSTRKEK